MADDADTTQDRFEREEPARLAASKKPEAPAAHGFCLYCNAPVEGTLKFCDRYCRDDYEAEELHRRIAGR
jgi:hypothetical protein